MPILAATAATWRVVRLHAADRHQRVRTGCDGVGDDIFELADFVAAESEVGIAVLALGENLDAAAQML